jgi:hypothetical protein
LARRAAYWYFERGIGTQRVDEGVEEALRYYRTDPTFRHAGYEMTLLRWTSTEAARHPQGPMAEFVELVSLEIGGALRELLHVFASDRIGWIVLAGGVGENFGRVQGRSDDPFLDRVEKALGQGYCRLARARLGVDAEFLGLALNSPEVVS